MREQVGFTVDAVAPDTAAVLRAQGIPLETASDACRRLLAAALDDCAALARPCVLLEEVSTGEFAWVYEGEGANATETPLDAIHPRADHLALFAGTLGPAIDDRIRGLFAEGDPALGWMLDAVASAAADRLADLAGRQYLAQLAQCGFVDSAARVLAYSPGYCGWDVSGQRRLFARLRPADIGIALGASCLMSPFKSVSGVLVVGRADIHRFRPTFRFCDDCATRPCGPRMASVLRG